MKKKQLKKRVQVLEKQLNHLASLVMQSSEKVTGDIEKIQGFVNQISRSPVNNPDTVRKPDMY